VDFITYLHPIASSGKIDSYIQATLNASNAEHVNQMYEALDEIYRIHAQGYRHDYEQRIQVLDADMSGQPCGA
jgi:hypothetical protein